MIHRQFPVLTVCFLILFTQNALAFIVWQKEGRSLELQGLVQLSADTEKYPGGGPLFPDKYENNWDASLRITANTRLTDHLSLDAHILEALYSVPGLPTADFQTPGPERSSLFSQRQRDDGRSRADLDIDIFYAQLNGRIVDLTIGRQAINLGTAFYFSPNDFFAPFPAQTFYRVYKPGVDGVRAEIKLGALSELTLAGILGYNRDLETENGWSRGICWQRSSLLAKISWPWHDLQLGLLGGRVREQTVFGWTLQGEPLNRVGIRAEGHYAFSGTTDNREGLDVTGGLEYRFPDDLTVRFEQFHHGRGFTGIDAAAEALWQGNMSEGYLGRDYSALSLSYEFSPLLNGELLTLLNWSDHSKLLALDTLYSLSDESEVEISLVLPLGERPAGLKLISEYGALPGVLTLTYRLYF